MKIKHEKFAWISSKKIVNDTLFIEFGDGYCTMDAQEGAYATVQQIRQKLVPGFLCSATAIVILKNGTQDKYVLIERDSTASIDPLKWQFPAGRMEYGESPISTALRETNEEVEILEDGIILNTNNSKIVKQNQKVQLNYKSKIIEETCDFIENFNTIEFFVPILIDCKKSSDILCFDKEPYGRNIKLFTEKEILELSNNGLLTSAANAIFKKFLSDKIKIKYRPK